MKNGPREKLLYTVTVQPNLDEPHGDYLATVDVDPESPTYCQVCYERFYLFNNIDIYIYILEIVTRYLSEIRIQFWNYESLSESTNYIPFKIITV